MTPARRALLLAALLVALAAASFAPLVREVAGPAHHGTVVLWGLPAAAGILSFLIFPRLPSTGGWAPAGTARRRARRRLLLLGAAALLLDQSFVAAGHLLGWLTFTFGDQHLMGRPASVAAWALPACLIAGTAGWERALRGGVLGGAATRLSAGAAAAAACLPGVALSAPAILQGPAFFDLPYVASAFAAALCREAVSGMIYLSGGGILMAGLYRGTLYYLEGFGVNDLNALFFPAVNIISSEPRVYLLRAASALLAPIAVAAGLRAARRER
jgi:hypothetical protein